MAKIAGRTLKQVAGSDAKEVKMPTAKQIRKAARLCADTEDALKVLFPEVFEEDAETVPSLGSQFAMKATGVVFTSLSKNYEVYALLGGTCNHRPDQFYGIDKHGGVAAFEEQLEPDWRYVS